MSCMFGSTRESGTTESPVRRLGLVAGVCVVGIWVLGAVAAPLAPYRADEQRLLEAFQPPSVRHPFGTDDLGRDVLTRVLYGGRYTLSLALGQGPWGILRYAIIPNMISNLVVLATIDLGAAVVTAAGLSFLGLGVTPPTPEWGAMVSAGRELLVQWWVASFPGLAIFMTVIGFNFIGDGIRDLLDPRRRSTG